jgi:hypothetical protein
VDTNCDPDEVDYVIPGNDDALRAIRLFASRIADAVLGGRGIRESAQAERTPNSRGTTARGGAARARRAPRRAPAARPRTVSQRRPRTRRFRTEFRRETPAGSPATGRPAGRRPGVRVQEKTQAMAEITAAMVKQLRDATGAGMMECKKALAEANGDIEGHDDPAQAPGSRRRRRRPAGRPTKGSSATTSTWAARSACSWR